MGNAATDSAISVWCLAAVRRDPDVRERVARAAGVPLESLVIEADEHGKPFVVGVPDFEFNLSHSHGLTLLACAWGRPVGIDVERVDRRVDRQRLLARCFTDAERAWLDEAPDRELLRAWAAKEAQVKAIGRGIAYGLRRIRLARAASGTLSVAHLDGPAGPAARWALAELGVGAGYVAMLVTRAPMPAIDDVARTLPRAE